MFIRTQENSRSGNVGREGGNNLAKRLQTAHVRTDVGGEVVEWEDEEVEEEERGGALISHSPGSHTWKHTDEAAAAASGSGSIFWLLLIKPPSRVLAL